MQKTKSKLVVVEPTAPTSAFSWHMQDGLLGNGEGIKNRIVVKGQEVVNGFG